MKNVLTPKKIVEELDKYIISQDDAKKNVAISLRNRYRRKEIKDDILRHEIMPKNIILIGPTGVGKTEIARRLAKIANAPFIKVEATKYTEVGYVGKDVESMIKDLVSLTFRMVKDEKIESLKENYLPIIYDKIIKKIKPYGNINEDEKNEIINEIKNGVYNDYQVEIEITPTSQHMPSVIEVYSGGQGDESAGGNIQDILGDLMSNFPGMKKKKKKMLKVKDAIEYLLKEEIEEKLDKDELIPEVIERVEQDGIIFIDEIDKIAERESGSRGEVSRQGVQRDILPIVEGTTVMTKYGPVKTDHILFIAAGAFSIAKPSDLMPELQGRFPIKVNLKSLGKEDFIKILTQVDNNLLYQYKKLLEVEKVNIEFTPEAISEIADYSIYLNEKIENIGARRLASVIEEVLKNIMYDAPYGNENINIIIDKNYVDDNLKKIGKKENLNDYIL